MKLLYFLDFTHFKQTGKSVTGYDYYAWDMGPVPRDFFDELTNSPEPDLQESIKLVPIDKMQKVTAIKKFDDQYFSKRELRILEQISFIFKEANADDMVESSHLRNEPWDKTLKEKGEFKLIDYMLSLDNVGSISKEEATYKVKERKEIHSIFGTL
jgi:uncharacterized phage-associated protein